MMPPHISDKDGQLFIVMSSPHEEPARNNDELPRPRSPLSVPERLMNGWHALCHTSPLVLIACQAPIPYQLPT
ncbi:hypothetical protein E2C01_032552 [Portunus trituberculatus]|uniref:Uncharacterized protein n=1 Tax=Portunus trituberculatus TaxID=210409 RepID=A0A5B7F1Q0_PORTR|nr:hypothetical protein [Portunus trituberculatus]